MLLLVILAAPGLIAGVVLGVFTEGILPGAVMGAPVVLWNLLAACGIFAFCRNTLHDMEVR